MDFGNEMEGGSSQKGMEGSVEAGIMEGGSWRRVEGRQSKERESVDKFMGEVSEEKEEFGEEKECDLRKGRERIN